MTGKQFPLGGMRSRLACIFLLLIMLLPHQLEAQTGALGGVCSLPDSSNWSGISVSCVGRNNAVITSSNGSYILTGIPAGNAHIRAGRLFYGSIDTIIFVTSNDTTNLDMLLTTIFGDTTAAHSTDKLTTSVTNIGNIGAPNRFVQPGDSGFTWLAAQELKEASFMIGTDTTHVSDAARYIFGISQVNLSHDFASRSDIVELTSGPDSTIRVTAFDDSRSNEPPGPPSQPLGVLITQKTSTFAGSANDGYMMIEMDVTNSTRLTLSHLLAGWFIDWNVGSNGSTNRGQVATIIQQSPFVNHDLPFPIQVVYQEAATGQGPFMGIVPLSQAVFHAARIASVQNEIVPTASDGGLTEANKYNYMSTWRASNPYGDFGVQEDLATIASVGGITGTDTADTFTLSGGGSITIGFALVGGSDSASMMANALAAQVKWVTTGHVIQIHPQSFPVTAGWQLVSLPVQTTSNALSEIYPNALSSLYWFDQSAGYIPADSLQLGVGYWVKLPASGGVFIGGSVVDSDTLSVVQGWNLIGGITYSALVSQIQTIPSGIIAGNIYGYNDGYFSVTTITPAGGFWLKASQSGSVILNPGH
jgi:hypothetical protein